MFRVDRRFFMNFDWVLLSLLVLVCGMAFLNLYSASYPPTGGMPLYLKQAYLLLMGVAGIIFLISFDYKELHFWNYPVYLLVIALLAIVLFVGSSAGGAQRWINLGFFQLQPSEPAKLMMVITLASYYSRKEVANGYAIKDLISPFHLDSDPARFGDGSHVCHYFYLHDGFRQASLVKLYHPGTDGNCIGCGWLALCPQTVSETTD